VISLVVREVSPGL